MRSVIAHPDSCSEIQLVYLSVTLTGGRWNWSKGRENNCLSGPKLWQVCLMYTYIYVVSLWVCEIFKNYIEFQQIFIRSIFSVPFLKHVYFSRVYMNCDPGKIKVDCVGNGKTSVALSLSNLTDVGKCWPYMYHFLILILNTCWHTSDPHPHSPKDIICQHMQHSYVTLLTCHLFMSTCNIIMSTCNLDYVVCYHIYVHVDINKFCTGINIIMLFM